MTVQNYVSTVLRIPNTISPRERRGYRISPYGGRATASFRVNQIQTIQTATFGRFSFLTQSSVWVFDPGAPHTGDDQALDRVGAPPSSRHGAAGRQRDSTKCRPRSGLSSKPSLCVLAFRLYHLYAPHPAVPHEGPVPHEILGSKTRQTMGSKNQIPASCLIGLENKESKSL